MGNISLLIFHPYSKYVIRFSQNISLWDKCFCLQVVKQYRACYSKILFGFKTAHNMWIVWTSTDIHIVLLQIVKFDRCTVITHTAEILSEIAN